MPSNSTSSTDQGTHIDVNEVQKLLNNMDPKKQMGQIKYPHIFSGNVRKISQLLHECEKLGTRHDLKYNAKKSAVMIYRSMTLK